MLLPSRYECWFRTSPDGRRVYYPRGWRGPGLLLDTAQEAALRHELRAGLWLLRILGLLGLILILAPAAFHSALRHRIDQLSLLALAALMILVVLILQARRDGLLKDCPGVAERMTRGDLYACLAARLSPSGIRLRIAAFLLVGVTGLSLFLLHALRGERLKALPLFLLAAVAVLPLRHWLQIRACKRTTD